ncbi:MAG: hypothetical protein WDW36_005091 [Sanguina aurantia]
MSRLSKELLHHVLSVLCSDSDRVIVNRALRALRSMSKPLTLPCDTHRTSITLHPSHLRASAPLLLKLVHLTAIAIQATPVACTAGRVNALAAPPLTDLCELLGRVADITSLELRVVGQYCKLDVLGVPEVLSAWRHSLTRLEIQGCMASRPPESKSHKDNRRVVGALDVWTPDLPCLTSLVVKYGQLEYLNLAGCPTLCELCLHGNSQLAVLHLPPSGNLRSFLCSSNLSLKTQGLAGSTGLLSLCCKANTSLTQLDFAGCGALQSINLPNNRLHRLNISSHCPALRTFRSFQSDVRSVDFSFCNALEEVACTDKDLVEVRLPRSGALTKLSVDGGCLSDLDLTTSRLLRCLRLTQQHSMTSFNLLPLTALQELTLSYNSRLATLDLTGCASLRGLSCTYHESLTTLNVSGCAALRNIVCRCNPVLRRLDVRGCVQLLSIDAQHCQLGKLDTASCPALISIPRPSPWGGHGKL